MLTRKKLVQLVEFVRDHPDYPEGCFLSQIVRSGVKMGEVVGGVNHGRYSATIGGVCYNGQKLSYLYHYGEWPYKLAYRGGKQGLLPEKMVHLSEPVRCIGDSYERMLMKETALTQETVQNLLSFVRDHPDYPEGCFVLRARLNKGVKIGSVVGRINEKGYWRIGLNKNVYRGHRLSWLYHHGEWPDEFVDHVGGVRHSLLPEKLRVVSTAENSRNIALPSYNTSGVLGVNRLKNGLWAARIMYRKVNYHLGKFKTKAEAEAVRKQAEIDFGFHPAHGLDNELREILYG